ncbi:Uncharacterised protein [Gallibacterium anatis]|uniref:Restriction endonuclease n=1 Tax=Gallibacterium anatis TaxID=750 RepID=A0A377H9E4_9PAST|nr:hypothetical protein [Gallibacterium anatis]KGQ57968.1 hypothetical protein IE01_03005 [Gallibacterium anatis DSM 16844 = F 149]STO38958.1 Uncharacterised protein [Gallibacterium anatis]
MIEELLCLLKQSIENRLNLDKKFTESKGEKNGFELLVCDVLDTLKHHNIKNIRFEYESHFSHHFPDLSIEIDNKKYGIELKSRNSLTWTTNGNSIFESISDIEYEEIYLFFGALDTSKNCFQIKYAPYWKTISDIKVTHSPRFFINMNSLNEKNIFTSNEEYFELRSLTKEEKNQFVSNKLRERTSESQWYLPDNEIQPILFSSLNDKEKGNIISEIFILYSHELLKTVNGKNDQETVRADYNNATSYIISEYYYYSPNFRDIFSAGGKFFFKEQVYPKVFKTLADNLPNIVSILKSCNDELRIKYQKNWSKYNICCKSNDNLIEEFFLYLDQIGRQYYSHTLNGKTLSSLILEMNTTK